eukprot:8945551-Pyramimonas_sp.AAC.1
MSAEGRWTLGARRGPLDKRRVPLDERCRCGSGGAGDPGGAARAGDEPLWGDGARVCGVGPLTGGVPLPQGGADGGILHGRGGAGAAHPHLDQR